MLITIAKIIEATITNSNKRVGIDSLLDTCNTMRVRRIHSIKINNKIRLIINGSQLIQYRLDE